ncbi:MAG: ATP phosphoribosyltransferase [Hadesarchaea archaeon]|nr:ATP phosphoribosyltransferase [Hadesarchaea archaeon]
MVRFAIPNKGRLQGPAIRLLEDAGIGAVDREERQLFARTRDPELELVFVRAQDIPSLVEKGAADLGITGYDLVLESGAKVAELLDLEFGFARMVVAASEKSGIRAVNDIKPGARVTTEFPNLARRYFARKKLRVELSRVSGAAEITPIVGVADLIVDLTSTGTTLRTHGLRVIDTLFETSARLVANRQSMREKRAKLEEVKTALESVVRARGKKLVMMNVPESKLAAIKRVMPGMAGPTVSRVEAAKPMLAVQAVVEAELVEEIVRKAKRAGARDILVVPIERVLP